MDDASVRPAPLLPPAAEKRPLRIEQLGQVRTDDYAWLKDEAWQKVMRDPGVLRSDIRAHLEAENAYTAALLAPTEALQAELFAEMRGRIKEDDSSVPAPDGPFDYYARYETGAQHPVYARTPRSGGPEEVLLDADAAAHGKAFFDIGAAEHSDDHALFAYAVDEQGSEYFRIEVKDLATGELLPGPVDSSTGAFALSPDSAWLFWVWRDENGRPAKVFRRPLRGGEDVLVYAEPDGGMFLSVDVTQSRAFIVIGAGNHETSEVRLIAATDPTADPRLVEPRQVGLRYELEHWDGRFVVLTNADGALDYKLCLAEEADPSKAGWRDWIAHRPGRFVAGMVAHKDWLVRLERVDANNRIVVTARDGLAEHTVGFDEEAYALGVDGGYEYDTATLRFTYQSPTTPRSTYDYDMATRERTLRKVQEVPSGHDPAGYVARRLHAAAKDGASVPITVLMRADTPLDGSAPLLLYGYGAYGIPMEPGFSIRSLSLVDRGWIWATAHIRGGTEKGWGWFLDGRGEKKPNTFSDFIACAEHLHAAGYSAPVRTVAYGGSAGGMLMGAVTNLRPDLWAGIVAAVPFVDVLNTMSDADLPLTPPEWPEWGNPLIDPAAYARIAGYSPYDNVADAPSPAVLATGGLSDPRVTYWEPAKWVARLRAHSTSDRPILLKINMEAGHGGASGRFDFLKEIAFDYAFAIWAVEHGWIHGRGDGETG
ncbi:S9 family peptidase [Caulobacter sp. S45]|uniref:S9 family peptidase n=1 Tax=Caulobacter sp. S45 TaxID=1641861 RepID=UPI0015758835|nr:S9 family peptidase [Caulobacter sp. S45]